MRIAFLVLGFAVVLNGISDLLARSAIKNDAMAVCQLSHSHDTCFQVLNR